MATLPEVVLQLQQLIPTKLVEDAPLLDSNWNKLIDYLTKNLEGIQSIVSASVIPPVGGVYIQFPGTKTPDELYPHPTAQWREISGYFPGCFLRLAGKVTDSSDAANNARAATFKSAVDLSQKNVDGTAKPNGISYSLEDGGSDGGQMDGIPNIKGTMADSSNGVNVSGGSTAATGFVRAIPGADGGHRNEGYNNVYYSFDASWYNAKYSDAITEVRPKNITIQIWLRDT